MTHRNNPQKGANMVDRYIGSAFDIVYAVYKHLPNMPVFLEFVNETSPRMEAQYADIIGRFDHIVWLEASALDSKEVAVKAAEDALEYRDTTQALIDDANEFREFVENVVENTIQDIQDRFAEFVVASGYQFIGNYGPGIEITEYNQLVRDLDGEFWRLSGERTLPYVTTGAGIVEEDAFIPVGDASLRQHLKNPSLGSELVQYDENNTVKDAINRNREDFWANKETLGGVYTHYVREDDGDPISGAECAVYVGGIGVLATNLRDKHGAPLANPFTTGEDGLVQFIADPGKYTLQVSFDLIVHTYSVYFADDGLRNDLADPIKGANLIGYPSPEGGDWTVADLANPDKGAALIHAKGTDLADIAKRYNSPKYDGVDDTGIENSMAVVTGALNSGNSLTAGRNVSVNIEGYNPVDTFGDGERTSIRGIKDVLIDARNGTLYTDNEYRSVIAANSSGDAAMLSPDNWTIINTNFHQPYAPDMSYGALVPNKSPNDHFPIYNQSGDNWIVNGVRVLGSDLGITMLPGGASIPSANNSIVQGAILRDISYMGLQTMSSVHGIYANISMTGVAPIYPASELPGGAMQHGLRILGEKTYGGPSAGNIYSNLSIHNFTNGVSIQNGSTLNRIEGLIDRATRAVDWRSNSTTMPDDSMRRNTIDLTINDVTDGAILSNCYANRFRLYGQTVTGKVLDVVPDQTGLLENSRANDFDINVTDVSGTGCRFYAGRNTARILLEASPDGAGEPFRTGPDDEYSRYDVTALGFTANAIGQGSNSTISYISDSPTGQLSLGGVGNRIDFTAPGQRLNVEGDGHSILGRAKYVTTQAASSLSSFSVAVAESDFAYSALIPGTGHSIDIRSAGGTVEVPSNGKGHRGGITITGEGTAAIRGSLCALDISIPDHVGESVVVNGSKNCLRVVTAGSVTITGNRNVLVGICAGVTDTGTGNDISGLIVSP